MSKKFHCLLLLMVLTVLTGCQTVKDTSEGAATGLSQDMHNISDPNQNGWNALQKVDGWMRENLW